jgi:sugar lactone lactonase YvrE
VRRGLAASLLLALAACAQTPLPFTGTLWVRSEDTPLPARNLPFSSIVQRRLLAQAHRAGDAAAVRAGLQRLAEIGYAPSEETLTLLAPHVPEAEMAALRLRFGANRARVEASRLVESVPAEYRLVEGIAWDERGQRLFAGTVVSRALLVRDATGWRVIEGLDAGSLFGLAIDRRRNLLWAASGRVEQTPSPETAFRGLIAVDLATLRPVRRLAAPEGGSPADITVGRDGIVYASDPASGAVYRAGLGDTALTNLVPPGRLHNPQGLVVSRNGRWLYVSDYLQGLAMINLADGALWTVHEEAGTMLDGIDGLHAAGDGLIAVQNGTSPRRILYLGFDARGSRITYTRVLESNHSAWGEPTLGVMRGRDFLYVADAQWERYGAGGAPQGEGAPRATAIRVLRPFNP